LLLSEDHAADKAKITSLSSISLNAAQSCGWQRVEKKSIDTTAGSGWLWSSRTSTIDRLSSDCFAPFVLLVMHPQSRSAFAIQAEESDTEQSSQALVGLESVDRTGIPAI